MTWRATAALGVVLALSLGLRLWARGGALIGYELVLPAQGLAAISTQPWGRVLRDGWWAWRAAPLSGPPSIILSVVPGALTALVPGRGWGIACNLLLTVGAFALLLRATWWSAAGAAVLFASFLTSNPMLSMAVCGYPRITGIVAHCMALWIILRLRRSPWATLGATVALLVLVPQLYDSGKLVVATFAVAAVAVRGARWQSRVLWTLFAMVLGGTVLWAFPSQPVGWFLRFGGQPFTWTWRWATALPLELWQREQLLPMLGGLALIGLREERLFLAGVWLAHVAWGMYQAASPSLGAAGYRLLPWECYATAILVLRARESRGLPWGLGVAMSAAIVLQLWRLAVFVQTPPMSGQGNRYTIPEPPMAAGWDLAKPSVVRWEAAMLADLRAGRRLWVLYNFQCYDENYAAPLGVPENLYLALGHERFVDSVVMFSDTPCRHDCLPFHPMRDLPAFVARASGEWVVWDTDCSAPEVAVQREMLASMPTRGWSAVDETRRGLVNLRGP